MAGFAHKERDLDSDPFKPNDKEDRPFASAKVNDMLRRSFGRPLNGIKVKHDGESNKTRR
jgi:hypothetical protein